MMENNTHEEMPLFRIWTCGTFLVERREGTEWYALRVNEWGGSHDPRRLLKKLLCSPRRRARRWTLIDDIWPDMDPGDVGNHLNDAAYRLRAVLRPTKGAKSLLITADNSSSYELPGQTILWIDADAALVEIRHAEESTDPLPFLEQAMQYFVRGAFLEEDDGHWASARRGTVEIERHRCLFWLAELYQQRGKAHRARELLSALLEEDPLNEDALCRLMEVLYQLHMSSEATRLYRQTLDNLIENGLQPSETTKALERRLQSELKLSVSGETPSYSIVSSTKQSHTDINSDLSFMQHPLQILQSLLTLGSTALVLSPYAILYPHGREQLHISVIEELETITASYWRLCANTSLDLLANIAEHFRTVINLLQRTLPYEITQRLCSLTGEIAQILGKTLFDLHEYALAWSYYMFSLKAAQTVSNHDLWATGVGRMILLLIYWKTPQNALPLLQEIRQLTVQNTSIACWLAVVEAEVYAHLGDAPACDEALRVAKKLSSQKEGLGEDRYAIGFNSSRLAAYEGACFVRLRQPERALPALQQALSLLDPQAIRRRSTILTDIGIAYAQQGNIQEACTWASQALTITTQTKSKDVLERVRIVHSELKMWKEIEEVENLARQLDKITALISI